MFGRTFTVVFSALNLLNSHFGCPLILCTVNDDIFENKYFIFENNHCILWQNLPAALVEHVCSVNCLDDWAESDAIVMQSGRASDVIIHCSIATARVNT